MDDNLDWFGIPAVSTSDDLNAPLEQRAQFLARQAVTHAMDAKEVWYPDGHLDYDMFADHLADVLMETVLRPLLLDRSS